MTGHHGVTVHHGDCLDVMRGLPDNSVDAIVCDPPYGLGFMGKAWDDLPPGLPWAQECLRVLKPGGHLLAFGGTRTWHRLACAIEDAGFEMRDSIAWLYGSGFPKSLDVSKAIDRAAGATRKVVGSKIGQPGVSASGSNYGQGFSRAYEGRTDRPAPALDLTAPATDDARTWDGWGTALKPAWESCVVGRKPAPLGDRIGSHLGALEAMCRRLANSAASSSAHFLHGSSAARIGSAPACAATPPEDVPVQATATGEAADSRARTATSLSEWEATTCLNIVSSWRKCLDVLYGATSTSTTGTTSSTTTDLTTLWSCLSLLTHPSTLVDPTSPDGLSSLARAADGLFAAAALNMSATQTLTATAPATSTTPATSPAGGARLDPIVVARKPLGEKTVAANVLAHGTGALNIAACRVGVSGGTFKATKPEGTSNGIYGRGINGAVEIGSLNAGRWPANVVLDDTQAAELDAQSGTLKSGYMKPGTDRSTRQGAAYGEFGARTGQGTHGDSGGASRFFPVFRYQAKAPASERPNVDGVSHATVKPLTLMRWLVRLVTPPGGIVLDPFAGSGTTVEACIDEGFQCIAIEREADYLPLIQVRIARAALRAGPPPVAPPDPQLDLFGGVA